MYRYETHLHTNLISACSRFTPEQIVEKYTRLGYAGVFVTDHFFNGNTTVPRSLPWEEKISRYFEGFRAVKEAAGDLLDVFFGLEYSYKGTDFLVYGLGEEWLLRHPEIMEMSVNEFCTFARAADGFVIQAHPYREAPSIDHIRLFPAVVDGLEVVNACQDARSNRLAGILADEYGLCKTGGSDIHYCEKNLLAGVEFTEKLVSEKDYSERVKRGEGKVFTLAE
ncbi:MAG: PHP domain-containing protein [Candidatus Gallimonas sp.]